MAKTKGRVAQFNVHADEPETVASFYASVFGWSIFRLNVGEGLPPHLIIEDPRSGSGDPLRGHVVLRKGERATSGFELIVAVESVRKTEVAIKRNGGVVLDVVPYIKGVGGRVRFRDPAGNVLEAFQFHEPRKRVATSNKRMQLTRSAKARRRGPRS